MTTSRAGGRPDPRAILTALGYREARLIEPVSGGRDTALFRVEHGGDTYALRVFRPGEGGTLTAETWALEVAARHDLPVPRVVAAGEHAGRPALLLEWMPGETVLGALTRHPDRAPALGAACGAALARVNAVSLPAEAARRDWLAWSGVMPADPLHTRLLELARHDRLLHLDFHPLNLLTDGERVTAILDWANARAGDPRADFARAITIARLDADAPLEMLPVVRAFERGFRYGYAAEAGPLPAMSSFHAWAGRAMLRDLAPRLAANPRQTSRFRRWIALWEAIGDRSGRG